MFARHAATVSTFVIGLFLLTVTPAWAGNYPPGGTGGTEVGGVKSGQLGGSGVGSGLANTGFDLTVLWIGLAVLAVGVVLLASSRRHDVQDDA